jgi:hypothetical protein
VLHQKRLHTILLHLELIVLAALEELFAMQKTVDMCGSTRMLAIGILSVCKHL